MLRCRFLQDGKLLRSQPPAHELRRIKKLQLKQTSSFSRAAISAAKLNREGAFIRLQTFANGIIYFPSNAQPSTLKCHFAQKARSNVIKLNISLCVRFGYVLAKAVLCFLF